MNVDRESKMSHSLLAESKEEKRNRFVKIFIEQGNWTDEDLLAFINDEFDNNVEDINWIFKTTLESKPSFSNRIFDVAMKNGPELQVLNDLGQTAIHIAAIHKQTYIIYELSDYFGDKNLSDNEGLTYFHVACMYDLTDSVQKYIDQGVDINLTFYKNGRRVSPLSLCLEHGSPITLKFLLNNGADLKLYDDWNEEPLSCLKRIKRNLDKDWDEWEILANHHFKELLKQTTDSEIIENRSDDEGFTYLHAACMSGSIEMVQKFIDQNNDLDLIWCLADGTKESPLTLATEFKRIEMVEMLLKNGANPNVKQLGKNPLHVFLKVFTDYDRDSNLLDLFISYNCDVNEKDNKGCSPLFLCFENCIDEHCDERGCEFHKLYINRKNLETLLKNKADISEVFANGQSILHLFISSEICRVCQIDFKSGPVRNRVGIELIKTLLKYGANVNAKDNNGDSPLHLAVLSCNLEVVEVLLAHGADVQSFDFSKLCWEYDWSISWLHKMIKFFLILHCLNDNGCIMDELSCLTVSKFLVNEINHSELCNEWERKIFVGSTNQIRSLLTSIKNRRGGDELDEYDKADLAHLIYQELQTIEKANMFSTAEMKDCLQQLQKSYMLEEEVISRIDTEISTEIEKIKKLEITNGLSLLDVCAPSPGKAYYLLKNSNFWAVIDSRKFEDDFEEISDTIRGYIIKCFMRKFLMDFGLKYLTLLTQGKLPILCCEHLIQYLNYDDVLNLCEAYVNKK